MTHLSNQNGRSFIFGLLNLIKKKNQKQKLKSLHHWINYANANSIQGP